MDADLSMSRHIDLFVANCFALLRQLLSIRQYVSPDIVQTLVTSLLLTRLDYGNAVMYGLPAVHLHRLQSVQNATVGLIFGLRRIEHITDALLQLHWLRVPERICFELAVLTYRALHGSAPSYLFVFTPVFSLAGRRCLCSASSDSLIVPRNRLSTVGDRAFPVAGATICNSLPANVTSSPSLGILRSRLRLHLFTVSYPSVVV
jgi:hypothetical protein